MTIVSRLTGEKRVRVQVPPQPPLLKRAYRAKRTTAGGIRAAITSSRTHVNMSARKFSRKKRAFDCVDLTMSDEEEKEEDEDAEDEEDDDAKDEEEEDEDAEDEEAEDEKDEDEEEEDEEEKDEEEKEEEEEEEEEEEKEEEEEVSLFPCSRRQKVHKDGEAINENDDNVGGDDANETPQPHIDPIETPINEPVIKTTCVGAGIEGANSAGENVSLWHQSVDGLRAISCFKRGVGYDTMGNLDMLTDSDLTSYIQAEVGKSLFNTHQLLKRLEAAQHQASKAFSDGRSAGESSARAQTLLLEESHCILRAEHNKYRGETEVKLQENAAELAASRDKEIELKTSLDALKVKYDDDMLAAKAKISIKDAEVDRLKAELRRNANVFDDKEKELVAAKAEAASFGYSLQVAETERDRCIRALAVAEKDKEEALDSYRRVHDIVEELRAYWFPK